MSVPHEVEEMEKPTAPIEPKCDVGEILEHAMSIAFVHLKREFKDTIKVHSYISTWRSPEATITISVPGTKALWDEYDAAMAKYRSEVDLFEAELHGVEVYLYVKAKEKLEMYNRKKCDKAVDKTVNDFIIELEQPAPIEVAS